jgi:predicted NAD/FAD-dependent oxidoreductase
MRIAVIGGGITGAVAASSLSSDYKVELFDQGRRGPGGRASHRTVTVPEGEVRFDHGCQFLRADDPRMQALVEDWCKQGWAAQWRGSFAAVGSDAPDFFGLPSSSAPVYVGVGGMNQLPASILASEACEHVVIHRGVRVSGMRRNATDDAWEVLGVQGEAAFHDTAEAEAAVASAVVLGEFDAVLLTDASSAFGDWHRASAGVPAEFAKSVRHRVRVPLFACMVAFDEPLGLPHDGMTFGSAATDGVLWWAGKSDSKPGLHECKQCECWTLVSTPRFAVEEITAVPMQDPLTGAFKPQEDSYLNSGPAPALLSAFAEQVGGLRPAGSPELPRVVYLQGQRWGSGLPAPAAIGGRDDLGRGAGTASVMGVEYERNVPPLVYDRPARSGSSSAVEDVDYLADDALRLYYAGDFTSRRAPGFEAAALAGLDVAQHMTATLRNAQ